MTEKPQLSIFTDPLPMGINTIKHFSRPILRRLIRSIRKKVNSHRLYGGHSAVTRSVVEGLTKIGANFNYNPKRIGQMANNVHVLGGGEYVLRQMIELKRRGLINRLTCGPNLVVRSTDYNSLIASPEIDGLINHCKHACELMTSDHPELLKKCIYWPAGVDIEKWKPNDARTFRRKILIFDKRMGTGTDEYRTLPYISYLREQGFECDVLSRTKTVTYSEEDFRKRLNQCDLMIGFTKVCGESQGIAWSEAWATDTPTLILQKDKWIHEGREFRISSAPFLTNEVGAFFYDFEEFKVLFKQWQDGLLSFQPRARVLRELSDEVSAQMLYRYTTGIDIRVY